MRHGIRIAVIWLVVSAILELLVAILPIPAPVGSTEAVGAHQTIYMLFYVGVPIFAFVWVLFVYNLVVFRRASSLSTTQEPAYRPDSTPVLLLWASLSFVIVLFLAGWGTFTLHEITTPPSPSVAQASALRHGQHKPGSLVAQPLRSLTVQVIGQQWQWTYRYPSYGGMETKYLELPVSTPIKFTITSLDVVHSFWIYDFDIKEDAVPGVANTAYMEARYTASSTPDGHNWVKCNELCGLWHGYMKTKLAVVPQSTFVTWAKNQEAFEKKTGLLKNLPKYASVYYPQPDWPPAPQDQSP